MTSIFFGNWGIWPKAQMQRRREHKSRQEQQQIHRSCLACSRRNVQWIPWLCHEMLARWWWSPRHQAVIGLLLEVSTPLDICNRTISTTLESTEQPKTKQSRFKTCGQRLTSQESSILKTAMTHQATFSLDRVDYLQVFGRGSRREDSRESKTQRRSPRLSVDLGWDQPPSFHRRWSRWR